MFIRLKKKKKKKKKKKELEPDNDIDNKINEDSDYVERLWVYWSAMTSEDL